MRPPAWNALLLGRPRGHRPNGSHSTIFGGIFQWICLWWNLFLEDLIRQVSSRLGSSSSFLTTRMNELFDYFNKFFRFGCLGRATPTGRGAKMKNGHQFAQFVWWSTPMVKQLTNRLPLVSFSWNSNTTPRRLVLIIEQFVHQTALESIDIFLFLRLKWFS